MQFLRANGLYSVTTNSDTTEGRGRDVILGYFVQREDALQASKGRGVCGSDAVVDLTNINIPIYESYAEYRSEEDAKVRQKAMSKLNSEERRVLGLEK